MERTTVKTVALSEELRVEVIVHGDSSVDVVALRGDRRMCRLFGDHIRSGEVCIEDIQIGADRWNRGYGSHVLREFLEFAKESGCHVVYGDISPVDWGHIDRLRHFYEKFGFDVVLDEARKRGKIRLRLLE